MSKTISSIYTGLIQVLLQGMKPQRRDITAAIISQNLIPTPTVNTKFGNIQFYSPNKEALEYPRTLLTREPETIKWIKDFSVGDVFWDVGSNVGAYALVAALVTKTTVLAFEPSFQTFSLLVNNIRLNKLDELIWPFCIALSNHTKLDFLNMPDTYASSVFNVFGDEKNALGNKTKASFRQKVPGFSIDDFVRLFNPPMPNHIKIDVDSLEPQILEGAKNLLKNKAVKSVLIEIMDKEGSKNYDEITMRLKVAGLEPSSKSSLIATDNIIFVRTKK